MDNVSAFMMHHVVNKPAGNQNKKNKKRRKARKAPLKIKENGITKKKDQLVREKPMKALNKVNENLLTQQITSLKKGTPVKTSPTTSPKIETSKNKPLVITPVKPISSVHGSPNTAKNIDTQIKSTPSTSSKNKPLFEKHFQEKRLFDWMISPIAVNDFMTNYWEKKPLHVSKRHSEYSTLLSTPIIDNLLHYSNIIYTKNIDITFYTDGAKELHNQEGVARPHVVWDFYHNKCSIRLLNPQTFVPNIHKLNSELQEYFGCFVGCNAYLTPPHSQGFAPHFDDIEAFILQIEGRKLWKVYEPRSGSETLPRYSSRDFTEDEIGKPLMTVLLEEGDLLYLPRGYIHQACTQDSYHSLHITVSAYQCNAWIDLLEKVVPKALESAWKNDVEFRRGLPLDYLKVAGFARNPNCKDSRLAIKKNIKDLIYKLADHVQIDNAVDQLGHKLMYDALPPVLTEEEKKCSVFGGGLTISGKGGEVKGVDEFQFTPDIEIVLLRRYVSRFVKEFDKGKKGQNRIVYRLYYTTDNSLEYHGETTSFFIIPKSSVKAVQTLFQRYPEYTNVEDLPHDDEDERITLVADLWERGIIRTKKPILKNI